MYCRNLQILIYKVLHVEKMFTNDKERRELKSLVPLERNIPMDKLIITDRWQYTYMTSIDTNK